MLHLRPLRARERLQQLLDAAGPAAVKLAINALKPVLVPLLAMRITTTMGAMGAMVMVRSRVAECSAVNRGVLLES